MLSIYCVIAKNALDRVNLNEVRNVLVAMNILFVGILFKVN